MKTKRTIILVGAVLLFILSISAAVLATFPRRYPEKILELEMKLTDYMRDVTLPIKEARLAMQPKDTRILMPVYGASVSSVADTWAAPRDGMRSHEGQDIFAARGTPVFSGTDGYIRRMRTSAIGGNNVIITGAGRRWYYYAHLHRFAEGLHVGQWVTTDTVLGFVGNTGNAVTTPPHLHLGMYERRTAINPLPLLQDRQ